MTAGVRTLEDVLREIKDGLLCYCVRLDYGSQEPGLDDTGQEDDSRDVQIAAMPGGFLGGLRIVFQGSVASVKALDLYRKPKPLLNPPPPGDLWDEKNYRLRRGAFVWGEPSSVAAWPGKLKERKKKAKQAAA